MAKLKFSKRFIKAGDKIFVKRYRVGFRGTKEFDSLVPAKTQLEARRKYANRRNRRISKNIIVKR